jgi:hypothetical protein
MARYFVRFGVLIATLVLLFLGCERGSNKDTIAPDPPVVLPSSEDTSSVEQGIDAISEDDWIHLEWLVGEEEDLAGYEIHRRREDESVDSLVAMLPIEEISGEVAFYEDEDVALRVRYFYTIKAFDEANNASTVSDTLTYMLLSKLMPDQPRGDITDRIPELVFQWGDDPSAIICYVIKVRDALNTYLWISDLLIAQGYDKPVRIVYNVDGRANSDSLESGDYFWRIDGVGAEEYSGSESYWMPFKVQ